MNELDEPTLNTRASEYTVYNCEKHGDLHEYIRFSAPRPGFSDERFYCAHCWEDHVAETCELLLNTGRKK